MRTSARDFWFFLSSWVLECLSSCLLKLFSSKSSFHFAGTIRKKLVQMHKTCWCVSEIRAGSDRKRAEHPEGERTQRPEHERQNHSFVKELVDRFAPAL